MLSLAIIIVAQACQKTKSVSMEESEGILYPIGFPHVPSPKDNQYTKNRWLLGKKLFYEEALSIDSTVSCSSCHLPEYAFADNKKTNKGVFDKDGTRNTPSLANIGYHPYLTREGGVPTLEMHVLVPIQEHNEFGFNILGIEERLNTDSTYNSLCQKAYGRNLDYYSLVRALSVFERTMISGNSPYDKYTFQKDASQLDASALRGKNIFFGSKAKCSQCHGGFNFTNYTFQNNGLYDSYKDAGRKRLTGLDSDLGKFKVPSLRNIEITAPYMHDGSLNTLDEVIEHYSNGVKSHSNKSPLLQHLNFSDQEKEDLKTFLLSLTDQEFINNKEFKK